MIWSERIRVDKLGLFFVFTRDGTEIVFILNFYSRKYQTPNMAHEEKEFNAQLQELKLKQNDTCEYFDGIPLHHHENVQNGNHLIFTGFIESIKLKKAFGFLVLRSFPNSLQCVFSKNILKESFTLFQDLPVESFVKIKGLVKKVDRQIKACTVKNHELEITEITILSRAEKLPFDLKDVNNVTIKTTGQNGDLPETNVTIKTRLDHRTLDLRTAPSSCIIKMLDETMFLFRSYLREKGFLEVKTPKLLESGTEGGANLFEVKYFKKKAYLAQSPQFYKQMMIMSGFKKVFEIGHVYRQEESNINRYLSEFIGLDLEMESSDHLGLIQFIYGLFSHIFKHIAKLPEYNTLKRYFSFEDIRLPKKPLILSHRECVDILRDNGIEIDYNEDFSRGNEKILGEIIAKDRKIDFFFIKNYPKQVRAFYTQALKEEPTSLSDRNKSNLRDIHIPDIKTSNKQDYKEDLEISKNTCSKTDAKNEQDSHSDITKNPETILYSQSFDGLLRGEEIFSGAIRINDHDELKDSAIQCGISPESIDSYLNCFKYGAPSHGGCGIGLERFLKSLFNGKDIRLFTAFPRDPNRLSP